MANRIPREFINQLLERIEIVDLIDSRIPLKKKTGSNYFACCPFHTEKSASFSVSQTKQFYHCFGCGAHGNAIDFLIQFDRMEFREAIESLAKQIGLEVPQTSLTQTEATPKPASLFDLLENVTKYYQNQLRQMPRAIDYLKQRGLSGQIAKDFAVGYAPSSWSPLLQALGQTTESKQQLLDTGMLIKKDDGSYYDRFRDRIMFPIHDRRGRIIGFGGRILDKGEPKYLNSPETILFQKGHELYGLYQALQANRQLQRALIVEGYMDVIALFQNHLTYAVATLGTATTAHHLERLFRYTAEIVFCFDGDAAGRIAAWRALLVTLPVMRDGIQIRFMFLPDGEDPDSLVRKEGKDAFENRMGSALTIADFFFQNLATQTNIESTDGRARFVKLATDHLQELSDSIFKQMMFAELARRTRTTVAQLLSSTTKTADHPAPDTRKTQAPTSPLRLAISLLVQQPKLVSSLSEPLPLLQIQGFDFFIELITVIKEQSISTTGALFEYWRDKPQSKIVEKLQQLEQMVPESGMKNEFLEAINRLKKIAHKQSIDQLLSRAAQQDLTQEEREELNLLIHAKNE